MQTFGFHMMSGTTLTKQVGPGSYEETRFNALRHGVLSRYTVLPWEDEGEYRRLIEALATEHQPQGPTEEQAQARDIGCIWFLVFF